MTSLRTVSCEGHAPYLGSMRGWALDPPWDSQLNCFLMSLQGCAVEAGGEGLKDMKHVHLGVWPSCLGIKEGSSGCSSPAWASEGGDFCLKRLLINPAESWIFVFSWATKGLIEQLIACLLPPREDCVFFLGSGSCGGGRYLLLTAPILISEPSHLFSEISWREEWHLTNF